MTLDFCVRLKEQRERVDKEHQEELDMYLKNHQDMKMKMSTLQDELNEAQVGFALACSRSIDVIEWILITETYLKLVHMLL